MVELFTSIRLSLMERQIDIVTTIIYFSIIINFLVKELRKKDYRSAKGRNYLLNDAMMSKSYQIVVNAHVSKT